MIFLIVHRLLHPRLTLRAGRQQFDPAATTTSGGCQHPEVGGVRARALCGRPPLEPAGSTVTMRRMRASTARGIAHGVWLATLAIWIAALILVFAIAPSDAIPMALLGLPMATYASVGALVARSSPRNLIGWLFSSVALALALWMFGSAYAQFGLGGASGIGDLPWGAAAAWTGVVALIAVLPIALPVFLGTFGQVWVLDPLVLFPPRWMAEIPGIHLAYDAGLILVVSTAFAGLLALVL